MPGVVLGGQVEVRSFSIELWASQTQELALWPASMQGEAVRAQQAGDATLKNPQFTLQLKQQTWGGSPHSWKGYRTEEAPKVEMSDSRGMDTAWLSGTAGQSHRSCNS